MRIYIALISYAYQSTNRLCVFILFCFSFQVLSAIKTSDDDKAMVQEKRHGIKK
jgi:hypothetical protein